MSTSAIDWDELIALADRLSKPGVGPGSVPDVEWKLIERSLSDLRLAQDWANVIRLREMFGFLVKGETTGGMVLVQQINEAAIQAAEQLEDRSLQAHYLHDSGENYHRQGYHKKSIDAFERSTALYKEEGEKFRALESYYFSSLPYRALGETARAQEILKNVLRDLPPDDAWRANPLQVMSWMTRDEGRFPEAEGFLREALELYKRNEGPESIGQSHTTREQGKIILRN